MNGPKPIFADVRDLRLVGLMRLFYLSLLALSACSPTESAVRSEIGSEGELPPAKVYPDEEISITLWKLDSDSPDQVSILIEPNSTLSARKYEVDWRQDSPRIVTQILDSKRLDEGLFDALRKRLSAYRPSELSRSGPVILPRGCDFTMHGQAIVNVTFRDSHARSGSFVLQKGCTGPSAAKIGTDLRDILSRLPKLDGTADYGWR